MPLDISVFPLPRGSIRLIPFLHRLEPVPGTRYFPLRLPSRRLHAFLLSSISYSVSRFAGGISADFALPPSILLGSVESSSTFLRFGSEHRDSSFDPPDFCFYLRGAPSVKCFRLDSEVNRHLSGKEIIPACWVSSVSSDYCDYGKSFGTLFLMISGSDPGLTTRPLILFESWFSAFSAAFCTIFDRGWYRGSSVQRDPRFRSRQGEVRHWGKGMFRFAG